MRLGRGFQFSFFMDPKLFLLAFLSALDFLILRFGFAFGVDFVELMFR